MSVCSSLTSLPTFGAVRGGSAGAQKGGKPPLQGEAAKAHQWPWSDRDVEEGSSIIQLSTGMN